MQFPPAFFSLSTSAYCRLAFADEGGCVSILCDHGFLMLDLVILLDPQLGSVCMERKKKSLLMGHNGPFGTTRIGFVFVFCFGV